MGKEIRHYDFTKKPRKASPFWMWVARNFAIKPRLKGRKVTVKKIGMTGIEPPYLLFVTHASMLDFPAMYTAVAPHNANNVVAIDAIRDVGDWIMRRLGCICKRKFVKDLNLIRNMRYCVDKYKSIVCIYPEARYTLDGTTGFLPDSLGKMGKLLKVPVVVLRLYGTFIAAPQWNKDEQYLPLRCELECVATAEEVRSLPADELNARIHRAMQRDETEGFSFGEAYGFIAAMSALGGIISGAVQYIYVYGIIGYGRYIERSADALYSIMARNGNVSASMENLLSQSVAQMQQSPEPSVFSAVGGGVLTSLLFGLVFGLFIASTVSRPAKPFGGPEGNV